MLISPGKGTGANREGQSLHHQSNQPSTGSSNPSSDSGFNSNLHESDMAATGRRKKEFIISVLIAFFILSKIWAPGRMPHPAHRPLICGFLHVRATSFTTNNCLQEIQLWLLITDSSGQEKKHLTRNDGKLHVTLGGGKRIHKIIFTQGRRYDHEMGLVRGGPGANLSTI